MQDLSVAINIYYHNVDIEKSAIHPEKDFPENFQPEPEPRIICDAFFPYQFSDEYKELKKRGGHYKLLAFLKLLFC